MKVNFADLINSDTPVLVDFYADWCGPCKVMAPVLQQVKSDVGEKVRIVKIDVDRHEALAGHYQVMSIPTLIMFKSGKEVWRQVGVVSASAIEKKVEDYA
ncbi:MAG: thioredoxin [Saprospiraceae bacterium]|nr:thioredoxin [Saprospiraceae bacterium]